MPNGGIVGIRAENVNICSEDGIPLKEGKYIKISIEDQGVACTEEFASTQISGDKGGRS